MLKLRPATADDWARLFAWRNDPQTREASFDSNPVALGVHVKWLEGVLADKSKHLFVAYDQVLSVHVGMVRADVTSDSKRERTCEVSVVVDPQQRGKGYAARMIGALASHYAAQQKKTTLVARVKPWNHASLRAFADNGFAFDKAEGDVVVLVRQLGGDK